MTFSEILPFLNEGFAVRRAEYDRALIIFKQVPASIDDVSHMRSIPDQVKNMLLGWGVGIDYENQYIIYDFITGIATYCVFDGEDINARDWEVVKETYNPYE
jgi:hypothetical protein